MKKLILFLLLPICASAQVLTQHQIQTQDFNDTRYVKSSDIVSWSAAQTFNAPVSLSAPGDFTPVTSAAFTSMVNGMDYSTMLASIGASSGSHAGAFGIKIPATATSFEGIGVGAYVENHSTTTQGIGGNLISFCVVNDCEAWGANIVADSIPGLTTGVSLIGLEVDTGILSPVSAYSGAFGITSTIGGGAPAGVVLGSAAFLAARNHDNRQWHFGYETNAGAINNAGLRLQSICATGTCDSQPVNLVSRSSDIENEASVLQLSSDGTLNFYHAGAGKFTFHGDSRVEGDAVATGTVNTSGGYLVNANLVIPNTTNGAHGNGTKVQFSDGTGGSGNLAKFDANGNVVDSGTAPVSLTSCGTTTTCANTAQSSPHMVWGVVTLSTGAATITGISPAFSNTVSFSCTATDYTAANPVKVSLVSTSSISLAGTGSDQVTYICVGN